MEGYHGPDMTLRRWTDLTKDDFAALDPARAIAVLPLGATEQHGPHLPVGTDTTLAEAVIARSANRLRHDLDVLVLPSQAVGLSPEHIDFPGTLSLSAKTVLRLWTEIGISVARSGLKKMVLFNGHGGNVAAMDIVARDLRAEHGLWVAHTSWFALADQAAQITPDELRHGIHGGLVETSVMLALTPNSVNMDRAQTFRSQSLDWEKNFPKVGLGGKPVKLGWMMGDLNTDGAAGDAQAASVALGLKLLDSAAEGLVAFLDQFDRMPVPDRGKR